MLELGLDNPQCDPKRGSETPRYLFFNGYCSVYHWKLCWDSPLNSRNSEDFSPAFSTSDCKEQEHLVSTIMTSWTYGDHFTRVVFEKLCVKWKTSWGAASVNGLFQRGQKALECGAMLNRALSWCGQSYFLARIREEPWRWHSLWHVLHVPAGPGVSVRCEWRPLLAASDRGWVYGYAHSIPVPRLSHPFSFPNVNMLGPLWCFIFSPLETLTRHYTHLF